MSKSLANFCSEEFVEVIPGLMQLMRHEMRFAAESQLSIPQFRVLARLRRGPSSNKELADWVGVSFPAMTRMVNFLVNKGMVTRQEEGRDRRKIKLGLTKAGEDFFDQCRTHTKRSFTKHFAKLTDNDKQQLLVAFDIFKKIGKVGGVYEDKKDLKSLSAVDFN